MDECIFCKIVKGEIPCVRIYDDKDVLAFADINPISKGHTLIIPKRHAENMWEASEEDLVAIMRTAKKLVHAIRDAVAPEGVAVLQLNGKIVNQVVMHYHLHLVPRSADEGKLAMTQWELVPGDMKEVNEVADKIKASIK